MIAYDRLVRLNGVWNAYVDGVDAMLVALAVGRPVPQAASMAIDAARSALDDPQAGVYLAIREAVDLPREVTREDYRALARLLSTM